MALNEHLAALHPGATREPGGDRRVELAAPCARGNDRAAAFRGSVQKRHHRSTRFAFRGKQGKMRERGQAETSALGEQGFGISIVVVGDQRLVQRMIRKVGLHQHLTSQFAAAGSAGNLFEQRKEMFGGAKFRTVERIVGAEDADQRHPGKVMPLGEHLRADEDIDLARCDGIAHGDE